MKMIVALLCSALTLTGVKADEVRILSLDMRHGEVPLERRRNKFVVHVPTSWRLTILIG